MCSHQLCEIQQPTKENDDVGYVFILMATREREEESESESISVCAQPSAHTIAVFAENVFYLRVFSF